ncbi:transcriptional regulator [Paenibacillus nasutitermitis]|uniref:Transcriptional regulator n=1 Tax=Paenibacillus nasutitermitis TaxID=1652958 RepID=A0A917DPJ9_9BACL|nr:transcriptional regulator [Paenibacillus nasutitermitis]
MDFIEENSFGTLVSKTNRLTATHLPFLLQREGGEIYLYSHMAKANPQWNELNGEVLVIFSGPQSYISPSWYAEKEVPTWNYTAVHLYGEFHLINEREGLLDILTRTVDRYESSFAVPWSLNEVSEEYVNQLARHIVGFRIDITHYEAAWKLHQDYSVHTQKGVIKALENRHDENSRKIAGLMKRHNNISDN